MKAYWWFDVKLSVRIIGLAFRYAWHIKRQEAYKMEHHRRSYTTTPKEDKYRSHRGKSDPDAATSCIVWLLLALVALPVLGVVLMCRDNPTDKAGGVVIFIVGCILWIAVAVLSQ